MPSPVAAAVIVGAGASQRLGGVDKVLLELAGAPVLAHTVRAFAASGAVQTIVLVLSARNLEAGQAIGQAEAGRKLAAVVPGGARRQDSVRAGLGALNRCDVVLVHDAARPLITPDVVDRCVAGAAQHGAVIAAVPAHDTVKLVEPDGRIVETLDRRRIWLAQTPQAFRRDLLERAHEQVHEDVTDDAAMVERLGVAVHVVLGDPANLKVTTPADLALAAAILAGRAP